MLSRFLPARRVLLAAATACLGVAAVSCGSAAEVPGGGSSGGGVITGAGGAGGAGAVTTGHGATSSSGDGGSGGTARLGPPYPIVLAHGFFGFESFAGVDYVTYFFKVKEHLEAAGVTVYTPAVDPFNGSDVRGAELVTKIEAILAETGRAKVNLIGHSQGGLDARVVAHDRPDLVASVITIGTPHHGTPVADIAMKLVSSPQYQGLLDWIANTVGAPLYDQLGNESSVAKAMTLFSKPGIAAFNAKYTDSPKVRYWSITGRTAYDLGGPDCMPDVSVPFVEDYANLGDPVDPLFGVPEAILAGPGLNPFANDGLVRAKDARWGQFLGCVPADHMDEVGQLVGDSPGVGNSWEYLEMFDALVAHLRAQGF